MIRDAIDFSGRFLDDLGRMVGCGSRLVGGFKCFVGGILSAGCRRLSSRGGGFGLLCSLLITRRGASRDRQSETGCEGYRDCFARVWVHRVEVSDRLQVARFNWQPPRGAITRDGITIAMS
ncbi:MAG: hypothetical protein Q7S58_03650 [Candidatus Binatus sp.]|uniref:hypothetical protein n=1 Tax=Candidatus Binatus sp. TaxID=2811406 RepID=UPI002725B8CB|nr:hypothetical protein [Candidatus Binatus sp.]MDO8431484.1 hypothetical protein [Candidatus Binatus sp.]